MFEFFGTWLWYLSFYTFFFIVLFIFFIFYIIYINCVYLSGNFIINCIYFIYIKIISAILKKKKNLCNRDESLNSYKLDFFFLFPSQHFSTPNQIQIRETKISFVLLFFHSPTKGTLRTIINKIHKQKTLQNVNFEKANHCSSEYLRFVTVKL